MSLHVVVLKIFDVDNRKNKEDKNDKDLWQSVRYE